MSGGAKALTSTDFVVAKNLNEMVASTCTNGDYYADDEAATRKLLVCQSGKNRDKWQYT